MRVPGTQGEPHFADPRSGLDVHLLLGALPAAAYTCDADGLITYFNQRAVQAWGREPKLNDPSERYCGSFRMTTPDGSWVPHSECWMALCLRDRAAYEGREIVVERPDGSRRLVEAYATPYFDEEGTLLGAVNIVVDVTERKRADDLLRRSERSLAEDLAAMQRLHEISTGLVRQDDLHTLLEEILDGAIEITHADLGCIQLLDQGSGVLRIVAARGFGPEFLDFFNTVDEGTPPCGAAMRSRRRVIVDDVANDPMLEGSPAGEVMLRAGALAVQSTPLVASSGELVGMLSTHYGARRRPDERELQRMDLLARQAAELIERARTENALKDAHRCKDEFLAVLAHELRNPLAPIRNAVELLRIKDPADSELRDSRDIIDRQVHQLTRLVDDLLDVSRINTGKIRLQKGRVELASIVTDAVESSRPLIDASGHTLTVTLPPEPVYLDGDAIRLVQVFSNLLSNAAKYTEHGGRIWVSAERRHGDAVVTVGDTGIGIDAPHLPRIFEMFSQVSPALERSQGGLGIGLSLVRGLVELHGGAVEPRSGGIGKGSEFIVRLPVTEHPGPPGPQPGAGGETVDRGGSCRVLVVDDNRDAAESLSMLLRLTGHDTRTAHDGVDAIRSAAAFLPDVVLLDIGLPGVDGYEAARRIRECAWGKTMLLIALTGWGQDEDKRRSKLAGFDYHLTKPVNPVALSKLLALRPNVDRGSGNLPTGL